MKMFKCVVCGRKFRNLLTHVRTTRDKGHLEYYTVVLQIIHRLLSETEFHTEKISNIISKDFNIDMHSEIKRIQRLEYSGRGIKIASHKKLGKNNPVYKPGVREKIRDSVKKLWSEGVYQDRINGMLGRSGVLHHNYKNDIHTATYLAENRYNVFLSNFQDISTCSRCKRSGVKINIHHIDENHKNFLPSNLEPLCIPCHTSYHYEYQKGLFMTVSKKMEFDSSHYLPNYDGRCSNNHGHRFCMEIAIRKRVDKKSGMVIDFKILKDIIREHVIDSFDHDLINNYIVNPTAENIVLWIWEKLMFDGKLKGISYIKLWETPDSCCILNIEDMLSVFSTNIEDYLEKYKN